MYYRNFEISVNEFKQGSNFAGHIAKIKTDNNGICILFVFAVDVMSILKYNLDLEQLLRNAVEVVKSQIDEGLFKDLELTFEYRYPGFVEVGSPKWWIKNISSSA